MKRFGTAILALALIAIMFGAPRVTHASGLAALCRADKYELAQGDSTTVYCTGFSPLTWLNVYYTEPDGTAVSYGDVKSDASGKVAFGWQNGVKNRYSLLLGTWTVVVQELGLAKQVKIVGTVQLKHIGNGDNVSGAYLQASQKVYDLTSEQVTLTGWGFAPGEIVSLWIQKPALCSSYTVHYTDGKNGAIFENDPSFQQDGTYQVDDIKADSSGGFVTLRFFGLDACEGTWRYAARGNTSGLGAYTEIALTGPSVSTNARLTPSKPRVGAFNDTIQFEASGFGANEILNCWTTSPDGRAVAFGYSGSFHALKVGADGSGVISLTTGSYIISKDDPVYPPGFVFPLMSEGSLGVWKMTCKGGTSGATAIAEYTVYGYELNP